jgi:hypothetical protein
MSSIGRNDGSDHDLVGSSGAEHVRLRFASGGRDDLEPRALGHREGREPDRWRAGANEQRLPGLHVETRVQRTVARLQHLGQRAEFLPSDSVSSGKTLDEGTLVYPAYEPSNSRPIPPIIAVMRWPAASSPLGSRTTVPTHSMPRPRGSFTVGDSPTRVNHSDRLSPKARTSMSTSPAAGSGLGTSRTHDIGPDAFWLDS